MTQPDAVPEPIAVSICIATRMRPAGLETLLGSLERLDVPERVSVSVVVIDNDPTGSARGICNRAQQRRAFPLHYAVEKQAGIPFARNAALALALPHSDFVAFIDDDEVPEPQWLSELLRVQGQYDADVVEGASVPVFDTPPPDWVADGTFHRRPRFPTGSVRNVAFTCNALVRRCVFDRVRPHFDESMATSGGSDSEFFGRVRAAGHSIVWSDDAITHERIPASRTTMRWIAMRGFRVGTSSAWIEKRSGSATLPRLLSHAVWCLSKGLAIATCAPLVGRAKAAQGLRLAFFGVGRALGSVGHLHREYRVVHGN